MDLIEKSRERFWFFSGPFFFEVENCNLPLPQKEQLNEWSRDPHLKKIHANKAFVNFWIDIEKDYAVLSKVHLLPFTTTHLCEKGFLSLAYFKNKYRNRLDVEDVLRLYL